MRLYQPELSSAAPLRCVPLRKKKRLLRTAAAAADSSGATDGKARERLELMGLATNPTATTTKKDASPMQRDLRFAQFLRDRLRSLSEGNRL